MGAKRLFKLHFTTARAWFAAHPIYLLKTGGNVRPTAIKTHRLRIDDGLNPTRPGRALAGALRTPTNGVEPASEPESQCNSSGCDEHRWLFAKSRASLGGLGAAD
jgi:hypothetical protein